MNVFETLRKNWNALSDSAKGGIIAGIAGILVVSAVLGYWLLRTDYQVLFSDLQSQDAATIAAELDRMKVPYKIDEKDSKILVDASKVHDIRLKLMSKGVALNGTIGFEIFDKSDYGMTEYAQKINYQRALQGELARTIGSIHGVKYARVHLVLPEGSLFKQNKTEPKASISLVLREGARLEREQIRGIQGLVAAAVPNLDVADVAILDQHGVILSEGGMKSGGLASLNGQLTIKKDVEAHLTRKAVEVLSKAFGPGQALVSVDATLNYDHVKTTEESIVPAVINAEGAVGAISRKRTTVQSQPYNGVKTVEQSATYAGVMPRTQNSTSEIEYSLGRKIEQIVTTPGSINRLSVSVLVPHDMDEERLNKLRDLVAMAVGINMKRGDAIAVHSAQEFMTTGNRNNRPTGLPSTGQEPARSPADRTTSVEPSRTSMDLEILLAITAITAALVLIALVVGLRAWADRRARRPHAIQELSVQEREALLAQIKTWIGVNGNPPTERVKP